MKKKLVCLCLCVLMVFSLLPAFAAAETDAEKPQATPSATAEFMRQKAETNSFGYIRAEVPANYVITDALNNGDMATYNRLAGEYAKRDTLPSRYDSRDYNWVTPVRNQYQYGTCWAHASMACVESYMLKHGIPAADGLSDVANLNLSETQHAFFTFADAYDAEGMLTGDTTIALDDEYTEYTDESNPLDRGGNGMQSAYTLMRWTGAASETVSALSYDYADTVYDDGLDSRYAYGENVIHVQNAYWIYGSNVDAVKRAIMENGAGNISYFEWYGETYICDTEPYSNHAITVIGWDDSIPASYFYPETPSRNGGWICKNSWGDYYFDDGYCYISYEDEAVCNDFIYFFDAEPVDNYDHNYQYDGTACNYGFWMNNGVQIANVFTAKGNETLQAIAFSTYDEATTYQVDVYLNPDKDDPSSGTLVATETGYLAFPGYFTIPLSSPVELLSGDTFSAVVTLFEEYIGEDGSILVPCDFTYGMSWVEWEHAEHAGTSYYRGPDDDLWEEMEIQLTEDEIEGGSFRIKAYTVDDVDEEPTTPFDGTIEWNSADVQFKGTTPYVIANGTAQKPRFTVKDKDGNVVRSSYYTYQYLENTNAGTGYVVVTFKAKYTGEARAWFKIYLPATTQTTVENVQSGIRISWAPVEGAAGYVIYRRAWSSTTNGWTDFVRWNNTTALEWIDGSDASHKVYAGTRYQYGVKAYFARRTDPVNGTQIGGNVGDNFNLGMVGPLKTTVRITTRKLNSVTAGSKQLTAKWEGSSVFTGYQVQIATNKTFTKNVQAVKIDQAKTYQTTIKSLKSGTTYYVRVRSYHEFNGMTYYGEWSNVLSCKVK